MAISALLSLCLALFLAAASPAFAGPETPVAQEQEPTPDPTATGLLDDVLPTRTPEPTGTPDVIAEEVERIAENVGLDVVFLGLSGADWINVGISILYVLAGYLAGTLLIRRLLPRLVRRTTSRFDDTFLETIGSDVRWLVVVVTLHLGTRRLVFVSAGVKTVLQDIYFVLGLLIALRIIFKLIELAAEEARAQSRDDRESDLDPIIVLLTRLAQVVTVLIAITVLLSHFGVNVTGFATVLGFGGLAISLAARDTIADAIAGFIVLIDQPFRIGDRIEIQEIGTWGDVVEIGLRTTRIRTRDNRLVIVPNSIISTNQIVNYSYPDPRYRIQTHVGIGYGNDIERVRQTIVDTVSKIEGVLPDKPVDALYVEMGDSSMIFRVRWWIESYVDTRHMFDRVHTALQHALDDAEIDCPFPTQNLNLNVDSETLQDVLSRPPRSSETSEV